ncbi:MAG TPA: mandelate racemase/muconate lactonizing enzyme family protein [Pseudolysinimonas sp.]|nr:mandelate racemase/muconate lactonizing enzyme family protein [Pseudolysinimonas sp.]
MSVIDRIETFRLGRELALVRVSTDDGAVGWGQTSTYLADLSVAFLHDDLAPWFLGRDPWSLHAVTDEVVRAAYKHGGFALFRALCGLDTAVLDLLATRAGVPVHTFLGGPVRTELPVYGSSMRRDIGPDDEADRLVELREKFGFGAFKIRIGAVMGRDRDVSPGRSEQLARTVRERLGDDVELLADGNGGFTAARAIQIGRLLEELRYFHFEEPCPYEELEQTAQVSAALDIRIAGGEQDTSLPQFARMIAGRVVDVVQPDIGYLGGVSRAMSVAAMADAWGMPCTPHCANRSLLQVFTAHLAAAAPSAFQFQEWSIEHAEWEDDLYTGVPEVVGGVIRLSERSGWGIDIDPGVAARAEHRESRLAPTGR